MKLERKIGKLRYEKKAYSSGYWIKRDSDMAPILAEVDPATWEPEGVARLFSAAPDLLEALRFSLTEWGQYDSANIAGGPMERNRKKAIRLAQAAIKKAEGR